VIVVPYIHKMSHGLLGLVKDYGLKIVFSVPFKLSCLTPFSDLSHAFRCWTKHRDIGDNCSRNVVYKIPLSCGKLYVGQTHRCLHLRFKEHLNYVKVENESSNIVQHLKECSNCKIDTNQAIPMFYVSNLTHRLVVEAYTILHRKDDVISVPSISLSPLTVKYLSDG